MSDDPREPGSGPDPEDPHDDDTAPLPTWQQPYAWDRPAEGSGAGQWQPPPPQGGYQPPYPAPYGSYPYASGYQYPYQQYQQPYGQPPQQSGRARTPPWLWPAVAALALVLGLVGGVVGGLLVGGSGGGDTSGGVLKVQRRTAPPLPANNRSVASVAGKVLPSTVQIVAEYHGEARGATGSGWVFDKQGHVITNNHVVAAAARDHGPIDVIDQKGRHHHATVIGRSPVYDIAVLRVAGARKLRPLAIGSSQQMRVGETVVAIGSPLGLSSTVTSGIISAVDRPVTTGDNGSNSYINALQTDAAINPGNSGGPLVNLRGQVIGVNSAIASLGSAVGGEGGNIGVGFAIPIEQVQVTTDQIMRTGHAEYPVIGASVRGTRKQDGAVVDSIEPGEPAANSALRPGDVITAVDGHRVTGSIDLVVAIRSHVPGETITLTVRRHGTGTPHKVRVKLDAKTG